MTLAAFAVLLVVSSQSASRTYDPDDVKELAQGTMPDGLQLEFAPPDDPGYTCPGVLFEVRGSRIHFTYVRSPAGEEYDVDLPIRKAHSGNMAVLFPYPRGKWAPGESVELIDANGRSLGKWTATE